MRFDTQRIDSELRQGPGLEPGMDINPGNIEQIRGLLGAQQSAPMAFEIEEQLHEAGESGAGLRVFCYRKTNRPKQPCLLWMHGGGYVLGDAEDLQAKQLAFDLDITVASVEYRLAPEHPFPAGLDDCWQALSWLSANAGALGIDAGRLAIGGASAGAGLAAGLALRVRDEQGPDLALQLLLYPMLDNLHASESGKIETHPVWSRATSFAAWQMYLGGAPGEAASMYAAAARCADVGGVAPAYICVGTEDLFYGEDVGYAERLTAAGVACEMAVFPGLYHAADVYFPEAKISQRLTASVRMALAHALA